MDIDAALEEFILESKEHLSSIEDDFLSLEGAAEPDQELVDHLFRAIHTMKGSCGLLGLNRMGELAHVMENIIGRIRSREMIAGSSCIDALLQGADLLKTMLDDAQNSNHVEIAEVVASLNRELDTPSAPPKPTVPAPETSSEEGDKTVPSDNQPRFSPSDPAGLFETQLCVLEFETENGSLPASVKSELEMIAQTLDSKCALNPDGELRAYVLLSSPLEPDQISGALTGEPVGVYPLRFNSDNAPAPEAAKQVAPPPEPEPQTAPSVAKPQPAASPKSEEIAKPSPERPKQEIRKKDTKNESNLMRVEVKFLDELLHLTGSMVMSRNQLISSESFEGNEAFSSLSRCIAEIHKSVVQSRMQPIRTIFEKYRRVVRDLSRKVNKEIRLDVVGGDIELDRTILESYADPLTHMIRNCIDHGIEAASDRQKSGKNREGTITLKAFLESGEIVIEVEDDGKGIDYERLCGKAVEKGLISEDDASRMGEHEKLMLIFHPGHSIKEEATELSGRGVGMDVVKTNIEKIGGSIDIRTRKGYGTSILTRLPLTQAIVSSSLISALVIQIGGMRFAIPESAVNEVIRINPKNKNDRITRIEGKEVYELRNMILPIVHLEDAMGVERTYIDGENVRPDKRERIEDRRASVRPRENEQIETRRETRQVLIVLQYRQDYFALLVDKIIGVEEIVVQPPPSLIKENMLFTGTTVLGDGRVVLILDVAGIVEDMQLQFGRKTFLKDIDDNGGKAIENKRKVIVFNNHPKEYFAFPMELISMVEKIDPKTIHSVGSTEYYNLRQQTIPIVRPEQYLDIGKSDPENHTAHLLVPSRIPHPIGILVGPNISTVDLSEDMEQNTEKDGMIACFRFDSKLIMMVDLFHLLEKYKPEVFSVPPDIPESRVLLVDDVKLYRDLLSHYLEEMNCDITLAADGVEAFDILRDNPDNFDLIVADIEMPRMNGFQLVQHIRSDDRLKDKPVIAITALSGEENYRKGMECGFDEYIVKIDRELLCEAVRKYADGKRKGDG